MRVTSVVGARPQFVKLAPVARAAAHAAGVHHQIVHTGQHYDADLSDIFFQELGIPAPDVHLGVGSGGHGAQTAAMLAALERALEDQRPDCVLVYGDTNSTLAAALAAVKLHLPTAHLEAGLRSFNRRMPEEHNRVLVDHASDLLLAPTATAMDHLAREGLSGRSSLVGDVMTDVLWDVRDQVAGLPPVLPAGLGAGRPYVVATVHRAENTDDRDRLQAVLAALRTIEVPVLLLAHPRLRARATQLGADLSGGNLHAVSPMGYHAMVRTVLGGAGVVTDSGGLQKEAFLLGVPCTTVRSETEWPETLVDGWNVLDPGLEGLAALATRPRPAVAPADSYGDGHAAERTIDALRDLVA